MLCVMLGLSACTAQFSNHGYVPPDEQIERLEIGQTRSQVADIIGSPGSSGVIRQGAWYYTEYRVRRFAYQAPQVTEREILAVSFNAQGRVSNIETYGLEDGQIVRLSRRVTTAGDVSFLRQLFGDFGRLNLASPSED